MKKSWFVIAAAIGLVAIGSIAVLQLSGDDARRTAALAEVRADPIPLSWRGAWSSDQKYEPGEVVFLDGSSYVAENEQANGMSPDEPCAGAGCPWSLMSSKGEEGAQGPTGPPGSDGAPGAHGAAGQKGDKGDPCPAGDPACVGEDGVSVTSAAEPTGTNCANGGSKFTAVNGVTYACNGAPGTGGGGGGADGWSLSGNAAITPGTNFLGTLNNAALDLKVNTVRALRLEPAVYPGSGSAPNVIGGHGANSADAGIAGATIAGGGFPAPLHQNKVTGHHGAIGGGYKNSAAQIATVAGGSENTASGWWSSVLGGMKNVASGLGSTVAGGESNTASGSDSFAGGFRAKAMHDGAFVWAGQGLLDFASERANHFAVRATGGVRIVTAVNAAGAPLSGVALDPGDGSWDVMSDRALKRDFAPVKGRWLLDRIASLPIATWSYKGQKRSIRHLGPTAQDFARAFGLGRDDRHISTVDSEGVSLAGVKALYKLAQAQQRQLRKQRRELDALKAQVAELRRARPSGSR